VENLDERAEVGASHRLAALPGLATHAAAPPSPVHRSCHSPVQSFVTHCYKLARVSNFPSL
jgi:hypothetical protein